MDDIAEVCGVLRFKNQHHLAGLLSSANITFEDPDVGIPEIGDAHYFIATVVVHAPISDVEKLRSLGREESRAIRDAMEEIWPVDRAGGTIIRDVVYRIVPESVHAMPLTLSGSSTGWDRVDREMDKLRAQLGVASTVEDHQQVGLLCREVLISLMQAVFDRRRHSSVSEDGTDISDADVKRMIEQYLMKELPGRGNKEVRGCVRSAYDLAVAVQHGRTSTYSDAALCVQATFAVVGMVEIISGKRGQSS